VMLRAMAFRPATNGRPVNSNPLPLEVEPPVKKSDPAMYSETELEPVAADITSLVPLETQPDVPDIEIDKGVDDMTETDEALSAVLETEEQGENTPEATPVKRESNLDDLKSIERVNLNDFSPDNWIEVRSHLNIGASLGEIASHCLYSGRNQDELVFVIDNQENSLYDLSHQDTLGQALSEYFNHALSVVINSGVTQQETPRAASVRDTAERHAAAVDRLNTDAAVVRFKALFEGSLDESSVKPID